MTKQNCPDGGRCHHNCPAGCFRVRTCGPLSGVYDNDEWPPNVVAAMGGPEALAGDPMTAFIVTDAATPEREVP